MKSKPTYELELSLKNQGYSYIIGIDEAGRGCEKPDAEVLTNNGWKYYTEIDVDSDSILSYTVDGNIEWQNIAGVVEKNFDGNLIELKNRSVHMLVTPDHCFDVLKRTFKRDKSNNNKLKMIGYKFRGRKSVRNISNNDFIPRGGNWCGNNMDRFILPSVDKHIYNSTERDYKEKKISMNVWSAFMGIYLSEGSCRFDEDTYNYNVIISQSKTSVHYKDIYTLLNKLPFDVKECGVGFVIYDKQLASYMHQFGDVYIKYIPNYIKELNSDLLNIFIQWAIKGDGSCYIGKNRQEVCTYYTVSERLRDDFEEILLKAGWTYKTSIREPKNRIIKNRLISKENQKDCFEIRLRRNNKISCKYLHKKLIPYKGKVFCLSLPNYHNFYVRRSGSGYFTGNSLAGPVVAASVMIPDGFDTSGINDSKKLSSKKRELFYNRIITECPYYVSAVDENMIDAINIREATKLAMRNVIRGMNKSDFALVDGNFIPDLIQIPARAVVNGDSLSVSIAAASIIAKVQRDAHMEAMHQIYPIYGFNRHKGYGTKYHRESIKIYGPCSIHRKTFGGVKEYVR